MTSKASPRFSLAALGVIACATAQAGPVTVTQSFALNSLMQGNSSQLSFDLSSFLSGQGLSVANVVSGQVVVHGFSEASYLTSYSEYGGYAQTGVTSHQASYSYYVPGYTCSWCWSYNPGYTQYVNYQVQDTLETRYRDVRHIDNMADSMLVSTGGSSASDTVDTRSASTGGYGNSNYEGAYVRSYDYYGNYSLGHRYNRERDVYEALYGALDTSLSLDAAALLDLRGDGQLGMSIGGTGQFRLQSVQITLDVDTPTVPEPGSLALAGAALAGLVVASRRNRKP
ncbi:MAG: PEP-CTERM sorting domain-containing protein [Burkholderiaceae bacterium]|nr:PEP-CTERM sorting domain-containing protein [Burkholderiaceae bacterium]